MPLASLHDPTMPDPGLLGGETGDHQMIVPGTPGTWVLQECAHADGTLVSYGTRFLPPGQLVDTAQLLQQARNHLSLPSPQLQLSPPAGQWQYVQMPTWAWVPAASWVPLTATAAAGAVTVRVTATPARLLFDYQTSGNGTAASVSCAGPGTPYSDTLAVSENARSPIQAASPDCGWTWHQSSVDTPDQKYGVSSRITYHVTWTVTGAPGGGDLGTLDGAATQVRVAVGEIQAVNTPVR
jgi:hypothetical protein